MERIPSEISENLSEFLKKLKHISEETFKIIIENPLLKNPEFQAKFLGFVRLMNFKKSKELYKGTPGEISS